jgi:hypothetical protein
VVPLAVLCSLFIFGEIENTGNESLIRLAIGSALIVSAVMSAKKKTT